MTKIEPIIIREQPEAKFRNKFKEYIARTRWRVIPFAASQYSMGWPDTLIGNIDFKCHKWVEFKATGGKLRQTQIEKFRDLSQFGIPIYVLEGNGNETDNQLFRCLQQLFEPPNWRLYIRI